MGQLKDALLYFLGYTLKYTRGKEGGGWAGGRGTNIQIHMGQEGGGTSASRVWNNNECAADGFASWDHKRCKVVPGFAFQHNCVL